MTHYLSEALWLEYLKQAAGTSMDLPVTCRYNDPAFASILEHYEWTIRTKTMSEETRKWIEAHDRLELSSNEGSSSGETSKSGS